jgi:hypothetical protein
VNFVFVFPCVLEPAVEGKDVPSPRFETRLRRKETEFPSHEYLPATGPAKSLTVKTLSAEERSTAKSKLALSGVSPGRPRWPRQEEGDARGRRELDEAA